MPGISFHYPQVFILLLLAPLLWRFLAGSRRRASTWLRLALALLALLVLSRPRIGWTGPETDLIVLVDRSASCSDAAERMFRELLPLMRGAEKPGDRLAVIGFGDGAMLEQGFAAGEASPAVPDNFSQATDLAAALRLAGALRSPDRRTAVLCLSDGRATGTDPLSPDVLAAFAGAPFWYRALGDAGGLDVAAGPVTVPAGVEPRSAWLVRYSIRANQPCEAEYTLSRNGLTLAEGRVALRRGENHFFARDTVDHGRSLEYVLKVGTEGDAVAENNLSRALLPVSGPPRALLVGYPGAASGLVARSLEAAAIPVDVLDPAAFPAEPSFLEPYRLVVLENCRLSDFPGRSVPSLAQAVETGLTALLATGGPNGFGMGGYHRSALDPLLPVEMELRNDIRRGTVALAIALDRSGSMSVGVGDGVTKMDLANLGAAESIRLLAPGDQVSVIAVDSAAHVVVPLSLVDNPDALVKPTLAIQSMGGGIFCRTALEAAAAEVRKSRLGNRHLLLFADADDAEEQEGCMELVRDLRTENILVSVVAMGDETDSDAQFLMDLALEGGGECLFSSHAAGLPALFTQEVMRISRRGFLEEEVTPRVFPAMRLLGLGDLSPFPHPLGYNVSSLREGSVAFLGIDDEFATPLLATRLSGRAATGAVLFEVDGGFSGGFAGWEKAPELLVALARRLAGGIQAVGLKAYSRIERGVAETTYAFSPEMARFVRERAAVVEWLGPDGITLRTPLEWTGPDEARAVALLSVPGHYLPVAVIEELGTAAAPSVSLSYSAEFALQDEGRGRRTLAELAAATGGGDGLDITQVRESADVVRRGGLELRPFLLLAMLFVFLVELSGRRLLWFS